MNRSDYEEANYNVEPDKAPLYKPKIPNIYDFLNADRVDLRDITPFTDREKAAQEARSRATPTPEELEAGLTHKYAEVRTEYVRRQDVKLSPEQLERALTDSNSDVRWGAASRQDEKLTKEQVERGLKDTDGFVREAIKANPRNELELKIATRFYEGDKLMAHARMIAQEQTAEPFIPPAEIKANLLDAIQSLTYTSPGQTEFKETWQASSQKISTEMKAKIEKIARKHPNF